MVQGRSIPSGASWCSPTGSGSEAADRPSLSLPCFFLTISGAAVVTSESRRRRAAAVTSLTACSNAASLARDGLVLPLSFRTNCSAEARTSSWLAGGSKLARVLMLRHMGWFPVNG